MRHRLPAVLATLVVLATLSTGVSAGPVAADRNATGSQPLASSGPVVSVTNTTGYLALPSDQRERFGTADIDVAGAAAMDSSGFEIRMFTRSTVVAFRAAPNATARTRLLRDAVGDLENRSEELRERQSAALRAYDRGQISTDTLLRRFAVADARANRLDAAITGLLEDVGTEPDYTLPTDLRIRFQNALAGPTTTRGPVKAAIGDSIGGDGPRQLYIGTEGESVVLARIAGGRYVRESFLADATGSTQADQFKSARQDPISAAYERARVLYPWAFDNRISSVSARGIGLTAVYQFNIDHSHGQLITYIDGRTNQSFREIQNVRLSRLPVGETAVRETENLTVRANLTHATGPMEVTVRDPQLNSTVDAEIRVGGTLVGSTGDDGSLWTVRPAGISVINASTAEHSTELTVGV
jgi:hypothetical protein